METELTPGLPRLAGPPGSIPAKPIQDTGDDSFTPDVISDPSQLKPTGVTDLSNLPKPKSKGDDRAYIPVHAAAVEKYFTSSHYDRVKQPAPPVPGTDSSIIRGVKRDYASVFQLEKTSTPTSKERHELMTLVAAYRDYQNTVIPYFTTSGLVGQGLRKVIQQAVSAVPGLSSNSTTTQPQQQQQQQQQQRQQQSLTPGDTPGATPGDTPGGGGPPVVDPFALTNSSTQGSGTGAGRFNDNIPLMRNDPFGNQSEPRPKKLKLPLLPTGVPTFSRKRRKGRRNLSTISSGPTFAQ